MVGSFTSIFWNRRSRARSFSKWLRNSLYVVEPMQRIVPPERAGFNRFDASIAPPLVAPAPMTVWISSMRSEEHTSELQSLMRISYAVFCLKKKKKNTCKDKTTNTTQHVSRTYKTQRKRD